MSSEIGISVKLFESSLSSKIGIFVKVCKRKDLVRKLLKPRELGSLFVVSLGKLIKPNFIYSWQAHQFKTCISDFLAENYTFKQQNKIQSMRWCLVHITYF